MRRAAFDRARTLRVWRRHLALHGGEPGEIVCVCEFQPGRFRKGQRVGGCGRAHCQLCHYGKIHGLKKPDDHRSDISFHEWLEELGRKRPWRRYRPR